MHLSVDVDESGRLVVRGVHQFGHFADLRFTSTGLEVEVDGWRVRLEWDLFTPRTDGLTWPPDGDDAWSIVPWVTARAGAFGVGVRLDGRLREEGAGLLAATHTLWMRFSSPGEHDANIGTVPVSMAGASGSPTWRGRGATRSLRCALCCATDPH